MMIDEYSLIKCIGKGAFGEVFLTSKRGTTQLFATKKVPKSKADSPQIKKYFINEITILREISHPYIIHFETIKHTIHNYYIITEFCNGGDLFNCLKKYKQLHYNYAFTEEIVQHLMRQIVSAIKYLHSKRIIHRDLKLENILVNFDNDNDKANVNMLKAKIKIIDFGFATHLGTANLRYSTLGSPINMDPTLLNKLVNKNNGVSNLIGYDEKADIWSLGTVCYELLIGHEMFNAQNMIELVNKVENGNYHVPTHLSKEVVSFLNGMLQYSAKRRLSAEDLSKHAFLTKNVKDFKNLDLRKVSNKVDYNGLNINIKRNQSIWAIFNEEDEKSLINIPGKYYVESPIQELEELLGIKNIVYNNNNEVKNPFVKPINININNKMTTNENVNNVNINNIQVVQGKNKVQNIDYNLLQKQQKMYREINLKNDKLKRYANYAYNNPYGFGAVNNYNINNNNNYYINPQPKYYTVNTNGINTTNQVQYEIKSAVPSTNTVNNVKNIVPQKNNIIIQNTQPQSQNQQYTYTSQPIYYQTNIQNIKMAPVKSQQDLLNQGFYQTSPNSNNTNIKTNTKIVVKKLNEPSDNNLPTKKNQITQPIQNIQVQAPVIIPNRNNKSPKNNLNASKISAVTTITTKTVQMPTGARMPKSYYDNYNQQQIVSNNAHSKSPIRQPNINEKHNYKKQMTFIEKPQANYYKDFQNINTNTINTNNIYPINKNENITINKYQTGDYYHSTKEIRNNNDNLQNNNIKTNEQNTNNIKAITTNKNNKEKKQFESYTIKYINEDFPETKEKSQKNKVPQDEYQIPSDNYKNHKYSADYVQTKNKLPIKQNHNIDNNINNEKFEHPKYIRNDSFPMPESDKENDKKNSEKSKNDESSENLDELIDFKLGDEICQDPEEEKYNNLNDDNDKEKEDNFEMTMKQKFMEKTVERPTIGVPPPDTEPENVGDDFENDEFNSGVFQTNKNNIFNNGDNDFDLL